MQVTTWRHVLIYSSLITALAVAVPLSVVAIVLYQVPFTHKLPVFIISGFIPFFITIPISIFSLNMLKKVNLTVKTLDNLLKYDAMTGLLTRANFLRMVGEQRKKGGFLAIVDADFFKKINDTYGHEAGDEALKHLASAMNQAVGPYGLIARLGGEEFAIYFAGLSKAQALLACTNFCSRLRNQGFTYNDQEIFVKASVGLVEDNMNELVANSMRRADICLYKAKKNGRDRVEFEDVLDEKVAIAA